MGFMDKARAAASDLAAKADTALANSGLGAPGAGEANKYFHDLGVLTFLTESGRPASAEDRERVMAALREMDARGAIASFALQTAAAPPPPPPPLVAATSRTRSSNCFCIAAACFSLRSAMPSCWAIR